MNLPALSRQSARRVDQVAIESFGMSGLVLMENAGRNSAARIDELAPEGRVIILCGRGNNAGDGYVIARHLQLHDRDVEIVSVVELDTLDGDAAANAKIANLSGIEVRVATEAVELSAAMAPAATLVDCLLGTGAQGELRQPYAAAVELANQYEATRIAIDVPSGLDCDTGEAHDPTFRADHTITFVSSKKGFLAEGAARHTGKVHIVDIGIPKQLLTKISSWDDG